jgi:Putative exonuclease, RdgC
MAVSPPILEASLPRCGDRPLEPDFRAQALQITMNHGDSQLLGNATIRDRAVLSLGVEAPAGFTLDQDTELRSCGEGNATVRYVGHALETDDMRRPSKRASNACASR